MFIFRERYNFTTLIDRQTTKTFALSSENVDKYEFLTGEDMNGKRTVRKNCYNQKLKYSPLGSELRKQKDIGEKKY